MDNSEFMLTTFDNPFDPFTEFEAWWKMDLVLGHNCCGLLARKASISNYFSDERNEEEIARAADEIVKSFPFIYKKVYRQSSLIN